ncbi:3455_t:CDS:2 [Ambispora gerdemannii]|uniref:Ubiquitin carboxyl-terminal hydrolase n=1 Tax=Ambispora gerdemannii TaxID=144530 RepID=A0A9N8VAF1_9GLOM|nr:3455_t:CDS:2 [Ambispora gerdemannii]
MSDMSDTGDWCLIESDPGVFTELIRKFNVEGVQVEEVWSLDDQTLEDLKPIHGLIFLFKWQAGTDSSQHHPDADLNINEQVYFAKQVINNACATQAILSILFNCPMLKLGEDLDSFRDFTKEFDPYNKGLTITNSEIIRSVHNSFARSDPFVSDSKVAATEKDDLFHFISYVPINGALFELDGLSTGPVNLGPCTENNWLDKVRPVIQERMARYTSAEIRFNLMALIKNREVVYGERISALDVRIQEANVNNNEQEIRRLVNEKELWLQKIELEKEKFRRYERENSLRKHNFIPLIYNLIRILAERGELQPQLEHAKKQVQIRKEQSEKKKGEGSK